MKAYKIDAYNNVITTIEMSDDHREISENIGCDLFCVGRTLPNGDTLFVDDEGYMKESVTRGFVFDGQFYAGNGVLLGCNRAGESQSVKLQELEFSTRVIFPPECFQIDDKIRAKAMAGWKIVPLA